MWSDIDLKTVDHAGAEPVDPFQKKVRIHSEKYLIRTIEADDASDRWASWMSDPVDAHA
jgi:hypothetical protein